MGEIIWIHGSFVCDTNIRGGCYVTRTKLGRRGYSISHMVLGLRETVIFNGRIRFERWVEIQVRGGVGLMVPKVADKDWIRHG